MKAFLRYLTFLSLIVWIGGLIYFSFVVAPSVFSVLTPLPGGRHLAGDIVNRTLGALQWIGVGCGIVFLAASSLMHRRLHALQNLLIAAMMVITLGLIFYVAPHMETIRSSVAGLDTAPPLQAEFNLLLKEFVAAEIEVLLLGLGAAWLMAKAPEPR